MRCWGAVCEQGLVYGSLPTFKNEYYHRHVFPAIAAARTGAYNWIDAWYNARRRHSKIGYSSPLQYERQLAAQAAWPNSQLSGIRGQPHHRLFEGCGVSWRPGRDRAPQG